MGTLISATAHGFSADDPITFINLDGGEGIIEGNLYYVLAAGLTTDAFAFSTSVGGAAFTYATDIVSGSAVPYATYAAVSDGVMDPPTDPTAPTAPSVASATSAGLVRLYVVLGAYSDAAVRVRSHEVQITNKYIASDPDWTHATTHNLPLGTTDFSIPAMGATAYAVRCRVQDVYGHFSDWNAAPVEVTTAAGSDALNAAQADLANDVPDGVITETKIADDAISTPKIKANAITADLLATTLLLASLIKTADSGRRIEIDVDGIRLYDTDESLLVRIPTDGSAVYVRGEVNASTFVAEDSTTLNGLASLSGDAVMTLQNGVSAPTSAPTLAASVDYLSLTSTPPSIGAGIAFDTTDVTEYFWIAADPSTSDYVAHRYNAATGAYVDSIDATGSTTTYTTTLGSTSHVSDSADASTGGTRNQVATPLTMPRAGTITKVSMYLAGYGGSTTCRTTLWDDSGNFLADSSDFSVATASFATGSSRQYNKSVYPTYAAANGETVWAGANRSAADGTGWQWDKDDGTGKTTKSSVEYNGDMGTISTDSDSKPNVYITYTYDVDTRLEEYKMIGIATDGTYVYTLDTAGQVWTYDRATLAYVTHASIASSINGTLANAGLFWDGTNSKLVVTSTDASDGTDLVEFVRFTVASGVATYSDRITTSGLAVDGLADTFRGGALVVDTLNGSLAEYWVPISGTVYAFLVSSGANVANRDFGTTATCLDGLTYDATASAFRGWAKASPTKVWKFSSWDWTTGGTTYWVGYGWSDGTSAYTECGPTSSVTVLRHQRLQVQNASLPGGTADAVRIYAYRGASDAAAGSRFLQAEDALTARYITDYAAATADPTTNGFSAGSPAELKSDATGWSLKGDGSADFTDVAVANDLTVGNDLTVTGDLSVDAAATMFAPTEFADNAGTDSTSLTTAGTYYAVTNAETAEFTPAYVGQRFLVMASISGYQNGAGSLTVECRITTSANAEIDNMGSARNTLSAASEWHNFKMVGIFTADAVAARKVKLYATAASSSRTLTTAFINIAVVPIL